MQSAARRRTISPCLAPRWNMSEDRLIVGEWWAPSPTGWKLLHTSHSVWTHFGRFMVEWCSFGVQVYKLAGWHGGWEWSERFSTTSHLGEYFLEGRTVASKWIKAAVAKRAKAKPGSLQMDPTLGKDRPALTDFMTDLEGPDGGVREPSALMVAITADGVRAGLKDEDCGGWCWREGHTLQDALDAIEKALQAGEGAFRGPRQQKGKKK